MSVLTYVHFACTEFLTALHAGDASAATVDAGGVLPGYPGVVVRDGYAGYNTHLLDAVHAWCGAHLLRDLRAFHGDDSDRQLLAAAMAATLLNAHRARGSRIKGQTALDGRHSPASGANYRGAVAKALTNNRDGGGLARDALTLARASATTRK